MKAVLNWVFRYKGALYVSGGYASAAVLLYVVGALSGGDGSLGAWYWVYFSAWPISRLFNIAVSLLGGFLPDRVFGVLYSASPILAGVLWSYLISRCVLALLAKVKASRLLRAAAKPTT